MSTQQIAKLVYRGVVGLVEVFCLLAALNCYGAYAINQNYFPNQSHGRILLQAGAFLLAFLLLSGECWWLKLFRVFSPKGNERA